jgi:hypothetical protein
MVTTPGERADTRPRVAMSSLTLATAGCSSPRHDLRQVARGAAVEGADGVEVSRLPDLDAAVDRLDLERGEASEDGDDRVAPALAELTPDSGSRTMIDACPVERPRTRPLVPRRLLTRATPGPELDQSTSSETLAVLPSANVASPSGG